jgi:putative DNA modification/repair radical SAM protein
MGEVVRVARTLREEHDFRGYIHLKTIPDASGDLLAEAGLYADRLSINIELPTEAGLTALAPEKDARAIRRSMGRMRGHIDAAREDRKAPSFAPGGQSTQMIIGADATDDRQILATSAGLYGSYRLKRVYYSAFSPIPDASRRLPPVAPPLVREHRLYQADWLMRFYGFDVEEIVEGEEGNLALDIDPKLAWALRHRERFPLDVNRAPREMLLRIPGIGTKVVTRMLDIRRYKRLRIEDVARLCQSIAKVRPFIVADGWSPRAHARRGEPARPAGATARTTAQPVLTNRFTVTPCLPRPISTAGATPPAQAGAER